MLNDDRTTLLESLLTVKISVCPTSASSHVIELSPLESTLTINFRLAPVAPFTEYLCDVAGPVTKVRIDASTLSRLMAIKLWNSPERVIVGIIRFVAIASNLIDGLPFTVTSPVAESHIFG